jgi:SAM-dependent methyltransferase
VAPGAEGAPSPLFEAERARLLATAGPVLDLACGRGRHALAVARSGRFAIGLDRDRARLAELAGAARAAGLAAQPLLADLEVNATIPLADASCGAVLVFRYLHRPLAPEIVRVLRPGGLLLYETFTRKHREISEHPRNPAFLLEPGELPKLFAALEPLRAEEARVALPAPEAVARLVARKPHRA